MTRPLAAIAMGFVMCSPAFAQDRDAAWARSMLSKATSSYENFAVEKALVFLDSVMLRRDLLAAVEVASAHKLMGAGHAVMARTEEATGHFVEALKLDETTSLDPRKFSATELAPFATARKNWLAGMSPDARAAMLQRLQLAYVRLGAGTSGSMFSVDGVAQGAMPQVAYWIVPAGRPTRISVSSKKCSTAWDSTITVAVGAEISIGRRNPRDCSP